MSSEPLSPKRIAYQLSPSHPSPALQSSSPGDPGSSSPINGHFESSLTEERAQRWTGKGFIEGGRSRVTIDMVPEVALLEIFDFYIYEEARLHAWHTLVHVCRKWRILVFGSPRRLKVRLHCKETTPVRDTLDVWPPLPIAIEIDRMNYPARRRSQWSNWHLDNIIPALEHNDRICQLDILSIMSSDLEQVLAVMQQPFPALTRLKLQSIDEAAPIDPDSFLGGSTSHLRELTLSCIPLPGLPKLLLSATHLVTLDLSRIPDSGYISPDAMVSCLSASTRLESLFIKFGSPRGRPDQNSRRPPPPTRTLLPALTTLEFQGFSEYLDDILARIDAPQLDNFKIIFFYQPAIFETPQLSQFISRTPKFKAPDEAHMVFGSTARITLPPVINGKLKLVIETEWLDMQVLCLAEVCGSSFPQALIHAVQHLYIRERRPDGDHDDSQGDIDGSQWLELLHRFTTVKDLYVPSKITPFIVLALKELVEEGVTEVLPALQNLFLGEPLPSGSDQEAINQFVAARELAGHPIAVSRWERGNYDIDVWK